MGQWIGYGKYVYSQSEKDKYKQMMNDKWHSKWITVWRLKNERLWTDKMIEERLGTSTKQGKYKVFQVEGVKKAECKEDFKELIKKRIEKMMIKDEYFVPPGEL